MRGFRLFERPQGLLSIGPQLQVVGLLDDYSLGVPYEGRLSILNAIGRCKVEIVPEVSVLPEGAFAFVDNLTKQVVLRWPAYQPPQPEATTVLNGDFQLGDLTGWHDRRGNSWAVEPYDNHGVPPGSLAAWMRGRGRGDHILESDFYPAVPGRPIMARSLWDQGPSNKDNNNLFTAIQFYDKDFVPFTSGPEYGDRIHDRTNKSRHWSTVNVITPPNAHWQTVLLIAHRRNGRNREIIVDDVETTGFVKEHGNDVLDDFYVRFKVTDSANRVAYWEGPIMAHSLWVTSVPYGFVVDEAPVVGSAAVSDMLFKIGAISGLVGDEAATGSASILDFAFRSSTLPVTVTDSAAGSAEITAFVFRDPRVLYDYDRGEGAQATASVTAFDWKRHPAMVVDSEVAVGSISITGFTFQ